MNKRGFAQRIAAFLEGKGFYIVLFLCVAAIGISGYYLFSTMGVRSDDTWDVTAVDGSASVTVTPTPTLEAVKPTVDPDPAPSASSDSADSAEEEEVQDTVVEETPELAISEQPLETQDAPTLFVWPLNGSTVTAFSPDTLIRDETMGDWRTHDGMDLGCELGTTVMATAEGMVQSVEHDDMLGTTITIVHGGGITSVYANLASETTVSAGDEVIAGDIIGTVGDTALSESALQPHLHFALYQDGEPVDPADYMAGNFS